MILENGSAYLQLFEANLEADYNPGLRVWTVPMRNLAAWEVLSVYVGFLNLDAIHVDPYLNIKRDTFDNVFYSVAAIPAGYTGIVIWKQDFLYSVADFSTAPVVRHITMPLPRIVNQRDGEFTITFPAANTTNCTLLKIAAQVRIWTR